MSQTSGFFDAEYDELLQTYDWNIIQNNLQIILNYSLLMVCLEIQQINAKSWQEMDYKLL